MATGFAQDPHSQDGQNCSRNLFSLTDYAELQPVEAASALNRSRELGALGVTGSFDSTHLRAIHHYILQDVFSWAGEFRVVNISKGKSMFGPAIRIEAALADALAKVKNEELLTGLLPRTSAERAVFYLGEINAIHPFSRGQRPHPARVPPPTGRARRTPALLGRLSTAGGAAGQHPKPYAGRQRRTRQHRRASPLLRPWRRSAAMSSLTR